MNMNEEELEHMDGKELEHMDGEELNEDQEEDLDGIKLEVVEGNKEGSRWLIVDSVHICHKQQMFLFKTMIFGDVRTSEITNAHLRSPQLKRIVKME